MTVPSKEDFEHCIELFANFNGVELIPKYKYTDNGTRLAPRLRLWIEPDYDQVYAFVSEYMGLIYKKREEIKETSVVTWLTGSNAFNRAMGSYYREGRSNDNNITNRAELAEKLTKRLLRRYEPSSREDIIQYSRKELSEAEIDEKLSKRNSERERLNAFHRRLEALMSENHGDFSANIIKSLHKYYYGRNIEHYIDLAKTDRKLAEKANLAIGKLLDQLKKDGIYNVEVFGKNGIIRRLDKIHADLNIFIEMSSDQFRPLKRNDRSARERLLICELWQGFQHDLRHSENRPTKATTINHLMSLEGIKNPPDQRAIEALIKGWKEEKTS